MLSFGPALHHGDDVIHITVNMSEALLRSCDICPSGWDFGDATISWYWKLLVDQGVFRFRQRL